jgi:hypothetical protein
LCGNPGNGKARGQNTLKHHVVAVGVDVIVIIAAAAALAAAGGILTCINQGCTNFLKV